MNRPADHVMNLIVVDDSLHLDDAGAGAGQASGLSVVIFRPEPALFPAVWAEDEVVQFRHMRIQEFQGSLQALSTNWSAFTVFARTEDGGWIARPERPVEPEERHILDRLAARTGHTAAVVRSSPRKPAAASRPLLTLDVLQPDLFFDLVAQVLRVLPSTRPGQSTLLLSDYTANPLIRLQPADFGLSPDLAHRLLLTTFWDGHADRAAALREGQFVKICNLRSKTITAPNSADASQGGLIAVLHGDRSRVDKIFPLPASSSEAKAILDRRAALLGTERGVEQGMVMPQVPSSPSRPSAPLVSSPIRTTTTTTFSLPDGHHPPTSIMHPDIPATAIGTLLQTSQVPAKFVIRGRVIGYQPAEISDICRLHCRACVQSVSPSRGTANCPKCGTRLSEHVFMLAIDVTDGIDVLNIIIAYQDAVRFFNGMIPHDLHSDPATVAYLRGALRAIMESPIPSPFCVKSYMSGSQRRYRLFDTLLAS